METTQQKRHCGILVNYECNAACRHCLYACSPGRSADYMTPETADKICSLLKMRGFNSIHIGGGEPFLNIDGLLEVIKVVHKAGITIEYVETNGFWAADESQALQYLNAIKSAGADALLISLDPFHAEYVPVGLPLRLAEMCKEVGLKKTLWPEKFQTILSNIRHDKAHSKLELQKLLSPNYILESARTYGLTFCGRAIKIEEEYAPYKPVSEIIKKSHPCGSLLGTNFFHVDLYEKYMLPGCAGITIPLYEAVTGIPKGRYHIFEALLSNGVAELSEYAKKLGFELNDGYTSSCTLCFHIRHWLSETGDYPELDKEYYKAVLL